MEPLSSSSPVGLLRNFHPTALLSPQSPLKIKDFHNFTGRSMAGNQFDGNDSEDMYRNFPRSRSHPKMSAFIFENTAATQSVSEDSNRQWLQELGGIGPQCYNLRSGSSIKIAADSIFSTKKKVSHKFPQFARLPLELRLKIWT